MITEKKAFEDAQVGDRVWDFLCGWGTITNINKNEYYSMKIKFNNYRNHYETYTLDGKSYVENNPSLFWDEIKFEIPEKPFDLESELKKLEIVEFKDSESNFSLFWNHCCNDIVYFINRTVQIPSVLYFTEKSIKNFMNNIEDKKISKEQFFEAYKKVFGGKIIC